MKNFSVKIGSARAFIFGGLIFLLLAAAAGLGSVGLALAKSAESAPGQFSPIHPPIELLDEDGLNVLESGAAVSTMQTCGSCHDTEFIASHSYHASAGLESFTTVGEVANGRDWDSSQGSFGRWNPLVYRSLTPVGKARST